MNHELRSAVLRTLPFLVVLIIVFILIKRQKVRGAELDIHPPYSIKKYLLWVIGFLVFTLVVEITLAGLQILEVDKWNHPLLPSVILITGAVIFAPIAEEILFRGFILNLLIKRGINNSSAICIQAVFFVLLHNYTYENTLSSNIGIFQGFIDAVLFGYARQRTQSLYTPITMHMTGNAVAIIERFIL